MKLLFLKYSLALFIIAITTPRAHAQWQQVFGPAGGDVEAIASDSSGHVYAGTDSGVYMSSNDGTTWTQERKGLTNPEIFSFAITKNGTVLAGTEGSGIFRTTNFGASWDSSSSGLPDSSNILSLASDGHGDLYAGHSVHGIFYSSDDGLHWVARNGGIDSQTIFSLTVAPNGTVYAGGNRLIFSSFDEGQHWDTAFDVLYPGDEVLSLAADSSGDIFAGTFLKQRFRLLAGNSAWEPITPFVLNAGDEVRALATVDSRVFLGTFGDGIFESGDFGSTWGNYSFGLTDPKVYSLTASPRGYLYAGTYLAEVFREYLGLSVGLNSFAQNAIEIWPQPCDHNAHLSLSPECLGLVRVEIRDPLGRLAASAWFGSSKGLSNSITIDVSRIENGVYYLFVRSALKEWSIPCCIMH